MTEGVTHDETAGTMERGSPIEVFFVALRLGLTSFGGPVAHLGYLHNEYVERRKWLSSETYAEVVGLAQALPGPASSQVGIAIGLMRAGMPGAFLAWFAFTMPSAIALTAFGFGVAAIGSVEEAAWLHGLKLAAVAIVALAVWSMARMLAPDKERASIAIVAALVAISWQTALAQVVIIAVAGIVGWRLFFTAGLGVPPRLPSPVGRNVAVVAFALFFGLLAGLPLAASLVEVQALSLFDSFYRAGSLVFGGGHVVLPLLEREVVGPGWVTEDDFLAGYGAAQAVPGPLFTFSAYLGTVMEPEPSGVLGATIALVGVFVPSFLLVAGGLAVWSVLRGQPSFQAALRGVNAAVVGLLVAALYNPVWTSAVLTESDFVIALAAFGMLAFWKLPPWLMVVFAASAAEVVARL